MTVPIYNVACIWDAEAGVWYATSDDVPGLVAEEESLDSLMEEVKLLAPDLLELNCGVRGPTEVLLNVTSRREERINVSAA